MKEATPNGRLYGSYFATLSPIVLTLIANYISFYAVLIVALFFSILFFLIFKKQSFLFFLFTICLMILSLFIVFAQVKAYNYASFVGQETALQATIESRIDCTGDEYCSFDIRPITRIGKVKIYIDWSEEVERLEIGDNLNITTMLSLPNIYEDFDYRSYLNNQGIFLIGKNTKILNLTKTQNFYRSSLNKIIATLSLDSKVLNDKENSLLLAMVLGFRENIPLDLSEDFKNLGLTHIIAVSGFNITILISFALLAARYINKRRTFVLVFILATLYMSLVGFDNLPALRAYILGMIVILTQLYGRKVSNTSSLLVAVMIVQFINIKSFLDIGFQLSLITYTAIIFLEKDFRQYCKFLPKGVDAIFSTSLLASVLTSPITLKISHQFPIIAPIANILILPIVPLVTILGLIHFTLKLLGITFIEVPLKVLLVYITNVSNFISDFSFSTIGISDKIIKYIDISILFTMVLIIFTKYKRSKDISKDL
ncbi:ComEC/Rec2 family competence protein [bacterium]|nr:MAG: ComEC/Rec2 family competence protein [bacterium]